jgi:hypothetical protein
MKLISAFVTAPFVAVAAAARKTLLGYYTLSSFAIGLSDLPHYVARKLRYIPISRGRFSAV